MVTDDDDDQDDDGQDAIYQPYIDAPNILPIANRCKSKSNIKLTVYPFLRCIFYSTCASQVMHASFSEILALEKFAIAEMILEVTFRY